MLCDQAARLEEPGARVFEVVEDGIDGTPAGNHRR
jgi:hypothetical protein